MPFTRRAAETAIGPRYVSSVFQAPRDVTCGLIRPRSRAVLWRARMARPPFARNVNPGLRSWLRHSLILGYYRSPASRAAEDPFGTGWRLILRRWCTRAEICSNVNSRECAMRNRGFEEKRTRRPITCLAPHGSLVVPPSRPIPHSGFRIPDSEAKSGCLESSPSVLAGWVVHLWVTKSRRDLLCSHRECGHPGFVRTASSSKLRGLAQRRMEIDLSIQAPLATPPILPEFFSCLRKSCKP